MRLAFARRARPSALPVAAVAPGGAALARARAAYAVVARIAPAGQADDSGGSPAIDTATMDAILQGAPDMTFTPQQVGQAQGPSSGYDAGGNIVQTAAQQAQQRQALSAIGAALGQAATAISQIIASNDQVALARLNAQITDRITQLQADQTIAAQQGRAADAQRAADAANALLNSQRALLSQPAAVPWGWIALGVALLGAASLALYAAAHGRGRGGRRSGTRRNPACGCARRNPGYGFPRGHGCGCTHGRERAA